MIRLYALRAHRVTLSSSGSTLAPYRIMFRDGEDNVHEVILTTDAAVALASSLRTCVDAANSGLTKFDAGKLEDHS